MQWGIPGPTFGAVRWPVLQGAVVCQPPAASCACPFFRAATTRPRCSGQDPVTITPQQLWIYVTSSLEKKQQTLLSFSRNEILDRKPTSQNAVKEATDSEAPLGLHPDPLGHPTTTPTILSYLTPSLGAYPLSAIRGRQHGAGLC